MRKTKFLAIGLIALACSPILAGCSSSSGGSGTTLLRVLNSEDYIYINDPKNGYTEDDLIKQFADYIKNDPELKAKYGKVQVVYDTADTMENIYSEMQTGKTSYDLICASDYIVAKMARYGLVKPVEKELIPNYFENYASHELLNRVANIKTTPITGDYRGVEQSLGDYAVGYMWGTLGLLFNPTYKKYVAKGYTVDEVIEDMSSFDTLWSDKYKGTMSIKDSMRDTFAIGLMETYKESYTDKNGNTYEGFEKMKEKYYQTPGSTYGYDDYQKDFDKLFNYVTDPDADAKKVVNDVKKNLDQLKKVVFGLEVDSGKEDIVTGKIGINMAWSGDAVYSMTQANDSKLVTETKDLYYAIPETGSNVWMDCWVMPKLPENKQSRLQWELAHEFLNYLSEPEIAAKNMNFTGYTSFIAGPDILDLVRDWYDIRTDEVYYIDKEENYYDVYAVDNTVSEVTTEVLEDETLSALVGYNDLLSAYHQNGYDEWKLYYTVLTENEEGEEVISQINPLPKEDGNQKLYGDLSIVDLDDEIEEVDLTYFFDGTLEMYDAVENPEGYYPEDMLFYSDEYSYFAHEYQEDGGIREICVGREFYTQYPDKDTLARCAVMKDYEDKNDLIMKMWEDFKSDPLPVWAIILFVILAVAILGSIALFLIAQHFNKKLRRNRIKQGN